MTPDADGRERVAILGGGPAGLTAAFELTATEELRERYAVTVYQLGWRLGGKGASGRNAEHGHRIEEHGLHIWFGFYENAFSLMRRCYADLNRPASAPLATWKDAFQEDYNGVAYELFKDKWVPHCVELPKHDGEPGDPGDPGFWDIVDAAGGLLESQWKMLQGKHPGLIPSQALRPPPRRGVGHTVMLDESRRLGVEIDEQAPVLSRLQFVRSKASEQRALQQLPMRGIGIGAWARRAALWGVAKAMNEARDLVWNSVGRRIDDQDMRFVFMFFDLVAAMVTGIHEDRIAEKGFGVINKEDFRAWLRRHGARDLTLDGCPLIRSVYSAAFCFEDGDPKRPNVAAGKAAQDVIRLPFFYKGAPMYRMRAGMGDAVFGPLYEVLRHEDRGVRFKFFNWITQLKLSPDHSTVNAIELTEQARVRGGGEYQPLVDVKGLPCWPSEPDWAQLEDGDTLRTQGVNFERDPHPQGSRSSELRLGQDFDSVVLAIPVGALHSICPELAAANPHFKDMLDHSHTVMTQAFQVWVKRDTKALGNRYPDGTLTSCYVEPVDTYSDMSQTLACENWPAGHEVGLVAYFCGVLPSAKAPCQADGEAYVRDSAITFLEKNVKELWPAFDWGHLVDPQGRQGDARFDAQYWRANCTESDRYALTLAGTVRYRLWPHQSGFDNLVLAGDWTRNGINGGAVEAAVTSGKLAARHICGSPAKVPGVDGWLMSDRGDVGWTPSVPIHA